MRILVSAESFGYGPITTGLNVVKELKNHPNLKLDFIGSGIALEQAEMSGFFDKLYICDTFDNKDLEKNIDIFKKYDILLSSENVNGAIFALKNGVKNTYYIDNLMWMWDKIPEGLNNVKKFFISETIPCEENFNRIGKNIVNPLFVGPVRNFNKKNCSTKNQLIINIGGAESFLLEHNLIIKFYNKIINDILSNIHTDRFDSILICGGRRVLKEIVLEKENKKVKIKTLAHEDYLKEMEESEYCILASGLGNFIESVGKNKNILFLPPINYSQLLQLDYYSKENLGFEIINWSNFKFYKEIPQFLDEETGVNMVVSNIKCYLEEDYRNIISMKINNFLNSNQNEFFERRYKYIDSLEQNASKKIAKIILDDLYGGEINEDSK